MMIQRCICLVVMICLIGSGIYNVDGQPKRILLDTDVDTDDVLALMYILKLDRSLFDLQAITINANGWTNAGHAVNQLYDILHMMGRDDVAVGVGGEGGILQDGTILQNVGGYLPIIEQGIGTAGYCRYSQVIPLGPHGRLDIDTKYGYRKSFLPQGSRRYLPLHQPTVQQVMIDKISAGPTTVFIIGANTNFALFLMSNPHLKKNVKHIYIMGGAVRRMGNVYTGNPKAGRYAEYNMFMDSFAAYQVIHSGIPITLIPLDATNTIPITPEFLDEFEKNQHTYEAQFCYHILKMITATWYTDRFYEIFFMWDSFLAGVATSIIERKGIHDENEFSEMEYMNITVITSNEPYGISDGSNPFVSGEMTKRKFNLSSKGVHSGHVQTGVNDQFCLDRENGCQDGYTKEVNDKEGVRVSVAVRAKTSSSQTNALNRTYYRTFINVLNRKQQTGLFNFTTQFRHYNETIYTPDFKGRRLGKNVVFDMDMSAGDILALFYLLKVPVEIINIKAILVTPTGWANAATIDVVYDLLHMMGRDDIPVGLGDSYALEQTYPSFRSIGDCTHRRVIPHGAGGYIDSDTLYGLARDLPRSPRRYTSETSVKFGAHRDTDHPELRQPLALEVWKSVIDSLDKGSNVTILTNGPLTNIAQIILADNNVHLDSPIQEIIVVGGFIPQSKDDTGNALNMPSNKYAELNMFFDPLAAKTVFESGYSITLVPLNVQRTFYGFANIMQNLKQTKRQTPEVKFAWRLASTLFSLKWTTDPQYKNVDVFSGEILGSVILAGSERTLQTRYSEMKVKVLATGDKSTDGQMIVDENIGRSVKVLERLYAPAYYMAFANQLGAANQSAVIGSFDEQSAKWNSTKRQSIATAMSIGCVRFKRNCPTLESLHQQPQSAAPGVTVPPAWS